MKSQLDSYRVDKSWYESMLRPKNISEKEKNHKTTIAIEKDSDDESDKENYERKHLNTLKQ